MRLLVYSLAARLLHQFINNYGMQPSFRLHDLIIFIFKVYFCPKSFVVKFAIVSISDLKIM